MTQRDALIAWYDSGAENRDEFIALIDAGQPQATPPAHMEAMRLALEALRLPCDRWNKTQTEIVNPAIAALEAEVGK